MEPNENNRIKNESSQKKSETIKEHDHTRERITGDGDDDGGGGE